MLQGLVNIGAPEGFDPPNLHHGNGCFGGRFCFRGLTRDRGAFTRVRFWCRADSAIAGPLRSGPVVTWIKQSIDSNNGGQSVPRTDLMTVFFGGVKYRL